MKIAIPVDENREEVCIVFGRTPEFLIYDTEKSAGEYFTNPAASQQGGAGIKAAQFLLDMGAECLITVRLGENSAEVLKEAGVKIYKSSGKEVNENIKAVIRGELSELTTFHGGFHGIS